MSNEHQTPKLELTLRLLAFEATLANEEAELITEAVTELDRLREERDTLKARIAELEAGLRTIALHLDLVEKYKSDPAGRGFHTFKAQDLAKSLLASDTEGGDAK